MIRIVLRQVSAGIFASNSITRTLWLDSTVEILQSGPIVCHVQLLLGPLFSISIMRPKPAVSVHTARNIANSDSVVIAEFPPQLWDQCPLHNPLSNCSVIFAIQEQMYSQDRNVLTVNYTIACATLEETVIITTSTFSFIKYYTMPLVHKVLRVMSSI